MDETSGGNNTRRNFILQQGFEDPAAATCTSQHSALLFQPRVIAVAIVIAAVARSPWIFFALAAVLWWSVLFPRWNPFDAFYNRFLAGRTRAALSPAPPPRRFAQGMAGTFMLAIGISLLMGWATTAIVLEILLIAAVGALVLGSFCLGSFVFYLLTGRGGFALRTLPWARETARPKT